MTNKDKLKILNKALTALVDIVNGARFPYDGSYRAAMNDLRRDIHWTETDIKRTKAYEANHV